MLRAAAAASVPIQAVGNVLHLQLLLGREEGQEDGPGCSQRGGWEALVHNGQQLELWASSAEGAPFLVVRPEVAGGRAPAGVGTSEEEEQGGNGDGDGEEELRVVGELGEERLGVLQGAGGANVAVTLAPGALKMLVGCYCGDVVFSRGALREGEEVLKQLLRGLPAVEEAVMPGEEEVKMEEDVPGPVSAAPQEVALLAVQQQLGQGQQQQGQVQQGQQGQPQGLVEFLHAAIDESVQRRRGQEDARQQGGLLVSGKVHGRAGVGLLGVARYHGVLLEYGADSQHWSAMYGTHPVSHSRACPIGARKMLCGCGVLEHR